METRMKILIFTQIGWAVSLFLGVALECEMLLVAMVVFLTASMFNALVS